MSNKGRYVIILNDVIVYKQNKHNLLFTKYKAQRWLFSSIQVVFIA